MNENPIVIIQTGHMRTGTTLLVNLLYGFMSPDEKIRCLWEPHHKIHPFNMYNIYKSHNLDIDSYIKHHGDTHNLFFVCTERDDKKINQKYKKYGNVLVFDYNEILETDSYNMNQIIDNVYAKLREFFPNSVTLDKETCIKRIEKMNEKYAEIENMDFSYVDNFFQLHGRHRNRDAKM
jgi:hypothetical protein